MPDVYLPVYLRGTALASVYIDAWIETGDTLAAMEAVRADPNYDIVFPGNRREDGSLMYTEAQYQSVVESYEDVLLSININPDLFSSRFPELIQGLVSPDEFATRIDEAYEGIIDQIPQVREYYSSVVGFDVTNEAIVASVLDPDVGMQIISGNIALSQVGGQAAARGFTIAQDFARSLVRAGVDSSSDAAQWFALAEGAVPVLNALARRHQNPDDDFDLEEFASASLFGDAEQRARMRLVLAQERASFVSGVAGVGQYARDTAGGQQGLQAF